MTPAAVVHEVEFDALPLWPAEPVEPTGSEVATPRTLEAAVDRAWNALEAGFTSSCLVCGGTVSPRWSAGAGVVGGRCRDCGTELA